MNKIINEIKNILYEDDLVQPYSEVIDLNSEIPIYKDLCNGTKENYTYTLWKKDILKKLRVLKSNELKSQEQIENFYHYLINKKRLLDKANKSYLPIMICATSIIVSSISGMLPNSLKIISAILLLGFFFIDIILILNNTNTEYCFYCDLIEIVEEMKKDCASHEP